MYLCGEGALPATEGLAGFHGTFFEVAVEFLDSTVPLPGGFAVVVTGIVAAASFVFTAIRLEF